MMPPLVSPCGGPVAIDSDAVAVRQIALVGPTLWKAERLYVYPSDGLAASAVGELKGALVSCARHEADGTVTAWAWQPVEAGHEAFFITGQRYRRDAAIPGNYRGIVMRQGRAVVMYVDFGPRTEPAKLADVPSHIRDAQSVSAKLAEASWS